MDAVTVIKGNGFNVTNAQIAVVADSKQGALMKALDKMDAFTARTGTGFSIENYTTAQVAENQFIVSVY